MTATTDSRVALRVVAHALTILSLGSSIAQVLLDPSGLVTGLLPYGLASLMLPVVAVIVGWLLALRRPHLSLGWILIAIGVLESTESAIGALGIALIPTAPAAARWLLWYGGVNQWAWIPPLGLLFTQVPLRFPDGLLPSPRWRWFSRYTMVALAITCVVFSSVEPTLTPLGFTPKVPNPTYGSWAAGGLLPVIPAFLTASAFIGSIASLFVRYRRSTAIARAQLRWIFWAVSVVVGVLILSWFGDPSTPGIAGILDLIAASVAALGLSLVPLAILFAVLRYGLYSIDRIISRTAAYAIVTLSIVAIYAGLVVLAGLLIPHLPSVGIALATLVTAAVFLPLFRVVRRGVDRRFNREQYDAQKVVDAFGERIRNGSDPQTAGRDLVAAIEQTLQPAAIGVWTTEGSR